MGLTVILPKAVMRSQWEGLHWAGPQIFMYNSEAGPLHHGKDTLRQQGCEGSRKVAGCLFECLFFFLG